MSLRISKMLPATEEPVVVAGGLYAVVFNPLTAQALKLISSVWQLAAYTEATHADFAIPLVEHAERTGYYFKDFADADITIPDSGFGQAYDIEYWGEDTVGVQDRAADILLGVEPLIVLSKRRVYSRLDETQQPFKAGCNVVFDSSANRLAVVAWLTSLGRIYTAVVSAVAKVYNSSGTLVATLNMPTPSPNFQFYGSATSITLSPNEVYFVQVEVVDASGRTWTSPDGLVTWD